jgi:hypothetical protein
VCVGWLAYCKHMYKHMMVDLMFSSLQFLRLHLL